MGKYDITPADVAAAQRAIDLALEQQKLYQQQGKTFSFDLNPTYLQDPRELAKASLQRYESIEVEAKGEGRDLGWPSLYTRDEVIERLAWTDLTNYGETPNILKVRDLNVYYWTQPHELGDPQDLFLQNERIDLMINSLLDQGGEASKLKMAIDLLNEIKRTNVDFMTSQGITVKSFTSTENPQEALDVILRAGAGKLASTVIPREVIEDYMRQFQKWWAKGTGIRNLLYKFFTGAITETEFNNAVLKFKATTDYEDGFYDEEMEV